MRQVKFGDNAFKAAFQLAGHPLDAQEVDPAGGLCRAVWVSRG